MKVLRIIAGITLVLAIVGVGLGAYAVSNYESKTNAQTANSGAASKVKSLTAEVTALQAKVKSQGNQLSNDSSSIFSLQDSTTAGQVSGLKRTVSRMTTCLPELQTEINGLGIDWSLYPLNTSKDSFTISNPTIMSNDCNGVLYGN